jgi:hypothetical protein
MRPNLLSFSRAPAGWMRWGCASPPLSVGKHTLCQVAGFPRTVWVARRYSAARGGKARVTPATRDDTDGREGRKSLVSQDDRAVQLTV